MAQIRSTAPFLRAKRASVSGTLLRQGTLIECKVQQNEDVSYAAVYLFVEYRFPTRGVPMT